MYVCNVRTPAPDTGLCLATMDPASATGEGTPIIQKTKAAQLESHPNTDSSGEERNDGTRKKKHKHHKKKHKKQLE